MALAAGMADGFTEVSQTLPEALRAHAFGISATAENLGFGVGMVVVASLLEHFAPLTVVGVSHGVAILVAAGFLAMSVKGAPRPAGAGDVPTPEP